MPLPRPLHHWGGGHHLPKHHLPRPLGASILAPAALGHGALGASIIAPSALDLGLAFANDGCATEYVILYLLTCVLEVLTVAWLR